MKQFFLAKSLLINIIGMLLLSSSALAFTEFDGKKTTIEEQIGQGKWTIAEVWASWCHACMEHMPEMVEFNGKMDNVRILGINIDGQKDKPKALAAIEEHNIPFKNIVSNSIEINAWMELNANEGLIGTPTFMIFDPDGKLVGLQPGQLSAKAMERFINSRTEETKVN